jgi:hypothetical protein
MAIYQSQPLCWGRHVLPPEQIQAAGPDTIIVRDLPLLNDVEQR